MFFKKFSGRQVPLAGLTALLVFFGLRELTTAKVDLGYLPPPMIEVPKESNPMTAPLKQISHLLSQNTTSYYLQVIWVSGAPETWRHTLTYSRISHTVNHKYTGHSRGGWISPKVSEAKIHVMASSGQAWSDLEWSHD